MALFFCFLENEKFNRHSISFTATRTVKFNDVLMFRNYFKIDSNAPFLRSRPL